jgi:hypothetical protein
MNPENMNQPATPIGSPSAGGGQIPMMPQPEKKGVGGVILLVIIILALLAGGYFLMGKMRGDSMMKEGVPIDTTSAPMEGSSDTAANVDPNTVQGTSTELSDIEKDLDTTDFDTLSADLEAI